MLKFGQFPFFPGNGFFVFALFGGCFRAFLPLPGHHQFGQNLVFGPRPFGLLRPNALVDVFVDVGVDLLAESGFFGFVARPEIGLNQLAEPVFAGVGHGGLRFPESKTEAQLPVFGLPVEV